MPRELTDHVLDRLTDVHVTVMDDPGAGGAHHDYKVSYGSNELGRIVFQNGPIKEVGINGLTHEALLAIIADRLKSFQAGPYACKANACALTHIEEAMHWLQSRTLERMRRGVEGTHSL